MEQTIALLIWIGISLVALMIFLWFFPVTLWFQALISGVKISLIQLVLMRWRKVPPGTIVMAMITGTKAGLTLYANELEAHYLAKGNVPKVVNALISADKANISLDFKMAAAIDLAGRKERWALGNVADKLLQCLLHHLPCYVFVRVCGIHGMLHVERWCGGTEHYLCLVLLCLCLQFFDSFGRLACT